MEINLTNLKTNEVETFTISDGVIKIPVGEYAAAETLQISADCRIQGMSLNDPQE